MTPYSSRAVELAAQLRKKAERNLGATKEEDENASQGEKPAES